MVRLFSHYIPFSLLLRVVAEGLLLFLAIVAVTAWQAPDMTSDLGHVLLPALAFSVLMTSILSALGLYRAPGGNAFHHVVGRLLLAFLLGLPVAYVTFTFLPHHDPSVRILDLTICVGLGGILILRATAFLRGTDKAVFARRVMVIGTGRDAAELEHTLSSPDFGGYSVICYYPVGNKEHVCVDSERIVSGDTSVMDAIRHHHIDEVVVAVKERRGGVLPLRELLDCKLHGISVLDISTFYERVTGQVRLETLRASWLIYGEGFRQGAMRTLVKRVFDIVASLLLLIVTLPVMLMAMLAILIESGFPILYRQERVGQRGDTFKVCKLRSMYTDAESDGKPRWASAGDDRITKVGRFIRKTRIDELPQILNVLKGDMSFVGPRPERPYFVDQLSSQIPFYSVRHSVKPGITGWAQVRYSYGSSVEDAMKKLQFDLYYVKNHTLFLDIVILFETIRVVLSGHGAR